jgi:glycosyltransferase involved in cell wall biosynthesis
VPSSGPGHVDRLVEPARESATSAAGVAGQLLRVLRVATPVPTLATIAAMVRRGVAVVRRGGITRILGVSDNGPALIAAHEISRRTGVPYALYLYDLYRDNHLAPFDRLLAHLTEGTLLRGARPVIVTNEATESYYRARYAHLDLAVVRNSVRESDYATHRTPYRPAPPYAIVFTGHVYWAQRQSVMNMIKAMAELRDLPVHLDLYTPRPDRKLAAAVRAALRVRVLSAPAAHMPAVQSRATLLFLPLAWNTPSPQIIATASPGKLTDYLAAGRPLLIHAPAYAFVTQYARRHELGVVVDVNDHRALAHAVRRYLEAPAVGERFAANATRLFAAGYEATANATRLWSLLSH